MSDRAKRLIEDDASRQITLYPTRKKRVLFQELVYGRCTQGSIKGEVELLPLMMERSGGVRSRITDG